MDEVDYRLSEFFRVLGNGVRLRIVLELRKDERAVTNLAEKLERTQQSVSNHLAILRDHDLVEGQTEGQYRVHSLKRPELIEKALELRPYVKRLDD